MLADQILLVLQCVHGQSLAPAIEEQLEGLQAVMESIVFVCSVSHLLFSDVANQIRDSLDYHHPQILDNTAER